MNFHANIGAETSTHKSHRGNHNPEVNNCGRTLKVAPCRDRVGDAMSLLANKYVDVSYCRTRGSDPSVSDIVLLLEIAETCWKHNSILLNLLFDWLAEGEAGKLAN